MNKNSSRPDKSGDDIIVRERTVPAAGHDIGLDEFEQFFREQFPVAAPAGHPAPAQASAPAVVAAKAAPSVVTPLVQPKAAPVPDPLAELARIVGQDRGAMAPSAAQAAQTQPRMPDSFDPFFQQSNASASAHAGAGHDPMRAFEEELRRFDAIQGGQGSSAPQGQAQAPVVDPAAYAPQYPAPSATAQHDAYAPHGQQQGHGPAELPRAEYEEPYPVYPPDVPPQGQDEPVFMPPPNEARRSRKVVMMLGAAAAVAIVGVVGGFAFSGKKKVDGQIPVIAAKQGPTKEKPANPGGVEVPGQDMQVMSKGLQDPKGPAVVVNKEEQPVDLAQTPKREVARVILPNTTGAPATPPAPILMPAGSDAAPKADSNQVVEPKRVKAVRIGAAEDTPRPPPPPGANAAPAAPRVNTSVPSMAAAPAPTPAPVTPAAKSEARPNAVRNVTTTPQPVRPATPTPAKAAKATAPAPATDDDDAAPMSIRPPAGVKTAPRVASAAPSTGGSGSFAVQLAAPPSEGEARATASRLKSKHSDVLGSYNPSVRKAEANNRTVYRVRVGGLSRETANDLCARLKEDGGTCFVASN